MAYAIGLGHDLGHAPFGHAGERALNHKCEDIGEFKKERMLINGSQAIRSAGGICATGVMLPATMPSTTAIMAPRMNA